LNQALHEIIHKAWVLVKKEVPPDIKSKLLLLFKKKYTNRSISHYINRWCLQAMDL